MLCRIMASATSTCRRRQIAFGVSSTKARYRKQPNRRNRLSCYLEPCAVSSANKNPDDMIFMSERGAPMSAVAFRRIVTRLGPAAKIPFPIHPHMLRHSTGFKLANQGVDTRSLQHYLGHKNIQHTVRHSELSPDRFRDFWKD